MKIRGQAYKVTIFGGILIFLLVGGLAFGGGMAGVAIYKNLITSSGQATDGEEDDAIPAAASGQDVNIAEQGDEIDPADTTEVSTEPEEEMSKVPEGRKMKINDSSPDENVLILVNKTNPISADYEPHILAQVSDYVPGKDEAYSYARPELVNAFDRLLADAKKEGLQIIASNAYRSYAVQKATFEGNVKIKGSVEAANKTSAKPGESEHQTGLAMDLTTKSLGYTVTTRFEETAEGKWIKENCHQYGFIIRFPEGKENITGYSYEPWHIRYVGTTAAKTIYERGWTLEEYLDSRKTSDNV